MTFRPTTEQRAIIDYPPVHLRVAAGAGTGKTTTIVERLAHFVNLGTPPTRALGITFTVKAADELRTRLRERIGTGDGSDEVEVSTYHGFAASILDEFGVFVGHDPDGLLLDEGHRYELGQLVLRHVPTDLDLTSMPHRIEMLMELNDGLERHLVTPEQLIAAAPDPVDTEVWAERLDLASAAMRYRSEKERLGLMEFSDLIARAVRLVGEFPDVAQRLGDRYDVVLLDEYQDTDPAQRLLLTSIFGPDTAVTAVGDTDQTIYEWRGASLDNFEAFPRHFPRSDGTPTETLPLSRNRRSDRHILDVANRIRDELPALDGAEDLKPGPDVQDGTVVTAWFSSEREEAAWIADDIVRRHDTGIPWSEIAVLVRKRAWIPELIAELHRADIPMSVSDPGTLLGIPEVADVLAWLRIVADPHAETALLRILLGGQYRLGLADINAMRLRAKAVGAESIFGALADVGMIEGLTDDTRDRLERFVVVHERVLRFAQANSVAATINRIVTEIGFWDEAAALRPGEATSARLNISRFMNLANGWRPIEGRPTVQRFLRYVDALDMTGREDALTPPIRPVADAIELTTVHGAKGLEWDAVYLPGLQDKDFPSSVRAFDDPDDRSRVVPYELRLDADSLTDVRAASGEERKAILRERNTASEYRLAYVAITRARRILTLSGHAWQDSVKRPKQPSDLLTMVREMAVSSDGPWCEDPGDKPPHRTATSTEPIDDPVFADGVEHALRQMMHDHDWSDQVHPDRIETVHALAQQMALEIGDLVEPTTQPEEPGFSTSVTNLVTLAECPLRFRWIHYDRMPRRPTAAAQRGTEFHRRVELHNLGRIALDDASPAAYDTVDDDTTETPTERSDPWGTFESSRFFDLRARFTEVPFEVALGVGSVRGKIDAVYEHAPQVWEIVDYKSGRAKTDAARRVQLQAYAIATTEGAYSLDRPDDLTVTFAYFGAVEPVEHSESVDDGWIHDARRDLERLVGIGAEGPWDPTPGEHCRSCDFRIHCPAGQTWLADHR